MKIIFAGTPEFAAKSLQALISNSAHEMIAVYTQPDRPAGRGRQLTASPVKQLAEFYNYKVFQPVTLRDAEEQQKFKELNPDIMIVVAYGLLLPKEILLTPRFGCINVHASLLPRWRGAAPIQRAILAGDAETGITIMRMDEGLDTGSMLEKSVCKILPDDTSKTLHDRLAVLGAETLLKTLSHLENITPEIQDNSQATYAHKINKAEAEINWNLPASELERRVRAFNPWPVAFFGDFLNYIRVWEAKALVTKQQTQPGTIIQSSDQGIDVATPEGVLRLLQLQLPGGKVLPVSEIIKSSRNQTFINSSISMSVNDDGKQKHTH